MPTPALNLLFVGDLNEEGRSFQRYRTFQDLGLCVRGISFVPVRTDGKDPYHISYLARLCSKIGFPPDLTGANQAIRDALQRGSFDVVWIEKGNAVRPSTLRFVRTQHPCPVLVSCSEDDMYARHNHSLYYRWGLKYYDVIFTTKTYNLTELPRWGAQRVELFLDAYDEKIHRPLELTPEDRAMYGAEVGFVGTFERDRAETMLYLAEHNIPVVVWGDGWGAWAGRHPNLTIRARAVYGDEYVKAIIATKVNLCFLRKVNRDETTSRTVEIPACGGFMAAERTTRHLEFFEEGKEAVFFGSREELLDLVRRYLPDGTGRARIAVAGLTRCLRSGYSHRAQLTKMLSLTRGVPVARMEKQ